MAREHGEGEAHRRLAEAELAVYPPDYYRKPRVYEEDRRYAVLVIDMLNDFVTGSLKCERAIPIVPSIRELLDAARSRGVPVMYLDDSHRPTDFELNRWSPHAMRGTPGAEVIPELKPGSADHVVPKTTYSGFYATDLDDILRSLYGKQGANTLILTGLHTDCCVRHTAADAFFRGYEVVVAEDGVQAFSEPQHRVGLQYLQYWYLADVLPIKTVIKRL